MPRKTTVQKAKAAMREGKRPTTAAGEFVREEIKHVREGKHGAHSPQQAIAIGLSKARRAGVPLPPQKKGSAAGSRPAKKRGAASSGALRRERQESASKRSLSQQAKRAAARRKGSSRRKKR